MNRTRTALVVGGGIAGPAAAMALQKIGVEATVHEARPDRAVRGAPPPDRGGHRMSGPGRGSLPRLKA